MTGERVTLFAPYYIKMINMPAANAFRWNYDRQISECIVVAIGDRAPAVDLFAKMLEFDAENSGLQFIEPRAAPVAYF
jgi:hypothetical protein